MRKSRLYIVVILTTLLCAVPYTSIAQRYALEFKTGIVSTSTSNSLCSHKSYADIRMGPTVGAGFSYIFADGLLRAVGEVYYTSQGEKYKFDDEYSEFESAICYFKTSPSLRFYTPYFPIYVGAGMYCGVAVTKDVVRGDTLDQSHSWKKREYYKPLDAGARLSIGTELGVGSVRFLLEAAYEHGLLNISNREVRRINNRCMYLTVGVNFRIAGRYFRPY